MSPHSAPSRAVLLIVALTVLCAASQGQGPSARAVAHFHDALFHSTLDRDGFGSSAVDLYWAADGLKEFKGTPDELNAKIGALYAKLSGNRIARADLSETGWKISVPAPLVLAKSKPYDLLLIASNATNQTQGLRVRISGAGDWQQSIELDPGESRALYPRLTSSFTGALKSAIQIAGGATATIPVRGEVRDAVPLCVRVLDPNSKPTAARVYVRAADGRSHSPSGAFDRLMWMTAEHYFYAPGEFTVTVPAGPAEIEVRKGLDYRPVTRTVEVSRSTNPVDIRIEHLRDMASKGWYSGDDHIHNNYTGEQWSMPENARLIVDAEDLHVGNMMVSNSVFGMIHDERYFEGHPHALSKPDEILYWNQEMRTWSYGHMLLLGLRHLVRPLYTGFPASPEPEDYPANYAKAQQARDQGGVALYAHPALRFDEIPTGSLAGELVADVGLGAIDGLEVFCSHDETSMELWYRFLNLGFKLAVTGGSDAFLNNRFALLAGGERMYVYTGDRFDYNAWIDGLKRGRTFATVGPLLSFTVNGQLAGSEVRFDKNSANVPVRVSAVSAIPMSRVEIVASGRVVATQSSPARLDRIDWSGDLPLTESAWIAARVWGPNNDRIANGPSRWSQRRSPDLVLLAHTSPVYITVGGKRVFSAADRDFCLRWLDSLIDSVGKKGTFSTDARRNEVLAAFARARQVYERMGEH